MDTAVPLPAGQHVCMSSHPTAAESMWPAELGIFALWLCPVSPTWGQPGGQIPGATLATPMATGVLEGLSMKGHEAFGGSFRAGSEVRASSRPMSWVLNMGVLAPHRLLSTITEPTSGGACDPPSAEEASSSPLVGEESEMDRSEHGGIKKVCFKVAGDDQEDSGHDTMSYRDSYR